MRYHCVVIHIHFLEIQGTITNSQFILNIFSIDMLNRLFNNLPNTLKCYYRIARMRLLNLARRQDNHMKTYFFEIP